MNEIKKYIENIDISELKKNQDNLKKELSKTPPASIVKVNKYAGNSKYVPIGVVQSLLDTLFLEWDWQITETKLILNSIMVSGRLTLRSYTGDKRIIDGVGCKEIQLKSDQRILSETTIGTKALEKGIPSAEAEALKSAAKKIGNRFGRNLNRDFKHEHIEDTGLLDKIFGPAD